MQDVDIEENVEQGRGYNVVKEDSQKMLADKNYVDNMYCIINISNKCNEWEGGGGSA